MKYNININPEIFNPVYLPLLQADDRILIVYGGAGSGKSHFLAQRLVIRMLQNKFRNFLVVRQTGRTNRTSTFALIRQIINAMNLQDYFAVNLSDMTITSVLTGNKIVFRGLDDVEKIKSMTFDNGILTDIWFEEATEGRLDDFEQLNLRLRGITDASFQVVLSFNPVRKDNWIYKRFFEQSDDRAKIVKTTYKDNKWCDDDYIKTLESLYLNSPEMYKVYALGEWGEPTEGFIFKREFYQEWDYLPADCKGIVYCDPNLSKKGQGDTTAIVKLWYSASMDAYYIADAICRSFDNSNELLIALLDMKGDDYKTSQIGFDGNVNQESTWKQHIQNFAALTGRPYPIVNFMRYRVDDLAKNAQLVWCDRKIYFPPGFGNTDDGERFKSQMYSFVGKKNGKVKDDAPDALICALQMISEKGLNVKAIPGLSKFF